MLYTISYGLSGLQKQRVVKHEVNNLLDSERDTHKILLAKKQHYSNKKERAGKQRRTHSYLTPHKKTNNNKNKDMLR